MADGFVKEPAVATQADFRAGDYKDRPDELEDIKLRDGVALHEFTKVELELYARQFNRPLVKPFMLVVAQDTTHANAIEAKIKHADFFDGQYSEKVRVVHSKLSGEEEDETIEKLLALETPGNTIEIVIHVNKLKEGWDVTNLYTIVPLRAASSRTLVEQSIGRGLRLPYGRRTGVAAVDRLTIVAHDHFQAIIDAANDPNSIIRAQVVLGRDVPRERKQIREVPSRVEQEIMGTSPARVGEPAPHLLGEATTGASGAAERQVAALTLRAIQEVARDSRLVPGATALREPAVQAAIERKVVAALTPIQPELAAMAERPDVAAIRAQITERLIRGTIDLPRIIIVPSSEVTIGFHDFDLDVRSINYRPMSEEILIKELRTNQSERITAVGKIIKERYPENYLIHGLIDEDDVDYEEQGGLLIKLAGQVIAHLRSYLADEGELHNVLMYYKRPLVQSIYQQMLPHRWEHAASYDAKVNQGFEVPIKLAFDQFQGDSVRNFRAVVEPKSLIPRCVFGGFRRCIYPEQRFSSDPERRFAVLLEDEPDESLKWFKPVRNQFKIAYRKDAGYEPDFVVETATHKYLCEPKMAKEMDDPIVLDKARAAAAWCHHATEHELAHGGKPWSYLLIPHDAISASATLKGLEASFTYQPLDDDRISPLLITR